MKRGERSFAIFSKCGLGEKNIYVQNLEPRMRKKKVDTLGEEAGKTQLNLSIEGVFQYMELISLAV